MTFLVALTFAVAFPAAGAPAQEPTNDPAPGSPSGTIYEIPLDQGRADAAPRPKPDAEGKATQPENDGSPIRSENNFGSSSEVPGGQSTPEAQSSSAGAGSGGGGSQGGGGGGNGSGSAGGKSGDGAGTKPETKPERDDGLTAAQERAARQTLAQVGSGPSLPRAYLLIALGGLVAAGLGFAAQRAARRN